MGRRGRKALPTKKSRRQRRVAKFMARFRKRYKMSKASDVTGQTVNSPKKENEDPDLAFNTPGSMLTNADIPSVTPVGSRNSSFSLSDSSIVSAPSAFFDSSSGMTQSIPLNRMSVGRARSLSDSTLRRVSLKGHGPVPMSAMPDTIILREIARALRPRTQNRG